MGRILYRGGNVYSPVPMSTALMVEDGRVAWVGSDAAAHSLGDPDAVVELDGAWLAPAFVDSHVHVVAAGLAMTVLDLSAATSLTGVLRAVADAAAGRSAAGVVWGTGWDETRWLAGPARAPTPSELDRSAGGRPVYLARADIHSAAASSVLLHAAGVEVTDAAVRGAAHHAVRRAARRLLTDEQQRAAAEAFLAAAARLGIAMVHECSGPEIGDPAELELVKQAAKESGVDLVAYWGAVGHGGLHQARELGAEPAGDVFVDGSLGSRTAWLSSPYLDAPGERGTLLLDPRDIAEHLVAATAAGAQAGFHVIGDGALSAVTQGFELAAETVGAAALAASRHRLEHLEMCSDEHRGVLARFGVIASVQPAFDALWGGNGGMYAERLGPARSSEMNDFAALAAAGIPLAFGSDAPVTRLDPWGSLRAATSPHEPSHALSSRAAFAAHTRGGHRAARHDGGGVLRSGADATFAVWAGTGQLSVKVPDDRVAAWSTDPRAGSAGLPDLLGLPPRCTATVVRGRVAFDDGLLAEAGVQVQGQLDA